MFRCAFPSVASFKHVVDTLSAFGDANWEFRTEGIYVFAMDGTHTTVVEVVLPADGLQEYATDRERVLGISAKAVSAFLKSAPNGKQLVLRTADKGGARAGLKRPRETNDDRVALDIVGGAIPVHVDIMLLEIDAEVLSIPENEWEMVLRMPCARFGDICKCLKAVDDTVKLEVEGARVIFAAEGSGSSVAIPVEADEKTTVQGSGSFCNEYAVNFMLQFATAGGQATGVTLHLSDDLPVLVQFDIKDVPGATVRFWAAPRVKDTAEN